VVVQRISSSGSSFLYPGIEKAGRQRKEASARTVKTSIVRTERKRKVALRRRLLLLHARPAQKGRAS
jgi:hypothetical protein